MTSMTQRAGGLLKVEPASNKQPYFVSQLSTRSIVQGAYTYYLSSA